MRSQGSRHGNSETVGATAQPPDLEKSPLQDMLSLIRTPHR